MKVILLSLFAVLGFSPCVYACDGVLEGYASYQPIVALSPRYPASARKAGVEGYVVLEFAITNFGSVENPVVVQAQPEQVFDSVALQAVSKFKFRPTIENGKAVRVEKVRYCMDFALAK